MGLAQKMFSRFSTTCPVRSDCANQSHQRYFESLFERDWEVFVIKHDKERGGFDWFTLCCETAQIENGN